MVNADSDQNRASAQKQRAQQIGFEKGGMDEMLRNCENFESNCCESVREREKRKTSNKLMLGLKFSLSDFVGQKATTHYSKIPVPHLLRHICSPSETASILIEFFPNVCSPHHTGAPHKGLKSSSFRKWYYYTIQWWRWVVLLLCSKSHEKSLCIYVCVVAVFAAITQVIISENNKSSIVKVKRLFFFTLPEQCSDCKKGKEIYFCLFIGPHQN